MENADTMFHPTAAQERASGGLAQRKPPLVLVRVQCLLTLTWGLGWPEVLTRNRCLDCWRPSEVQDRSAPDGKQRRGCSREDAQEKMPTYPASCESWKPYNPRGSGNARESWRTRRAGNSDVSFDSLDVAWPPGRPRYSGQPRDPWHPRRTCRETPSVMPGVEAPTPPGFLPCCPEGHKA